MLEDSSALTKDSYRLEAINEVNLSKLKLLNSILFPISYSPIFYKMVLLIGDYSRLCFYKDNCVGAICCRVDTSELDDTLEEGECSIYLMTLGVLSPYRRLGLGGALLEYILEKTKDSQFKRIYLHVQINNDEAIQFYLKYGFKILERVGNYYRNIEPTDAYILELQL
ncbi:hypothetical protein K502DRAFT_289651 [Neoconidiobolus thromboides FSU 785]|nr:hypothetical protein K502DRAFT_289651 [Neoconidiobolus thromboides FSU 785]